MKSTPTEENWYAEPFTKSKSCHTPGQCDDDCDCDCSYAGMAQAENLPLIEDLAAIFPNEWLAFIVSPAEDDDPAPTHGKLVAHSPHPDEIFDAVNTVLWNQCVYTFFNGPAEAMQASYGETLNAPEQTAPQPMAAPSTPPEAAIVPEKLIDLLHSALDELYRTPPNPGEAIRRLRIAKVRLSYQADSPLHPLIDRALDGLEAAPVMVSEIIWQLEDDLSAFKVSI